MHSKFIEEEKKLRTKYDNAEKLAKLMQIEKFKAKEDLLKMETQIKTLKQRRPDNYIRIRNRFKQKMNKLKHRINKPKLSII